MLKPFLQLDVFGVGPYSGNPLAVVADADGLTTEQMKAISEWTNLSECTFLLEPSTPDADYRVRIFNLALELTFAGHPTLGSARAWLATGGQPKRDRVVVQECGAGLVPVRHDGDHFAFAAPPLQRSGPLDDDLLEAVVAVLGISSDVVDSSWIDNGPGWIGILLEDSDSVLELEPDISRYTGSERLDIGVVGPCPKDDEAAFELRAFFTDEQGALREDPVTGSLNASAAQWLVGTGRVHPPYVARQGTRLRRTGRITVDSADGELWIGGQAVIAISGEIDVSA